MRKPILIIITFVLILAIGYANRTTTDPVETRSVLGQPSGTEKTVPSSVYFDKNEYSVVVAPVDIAEDLTLHTNLKDPQESIDLFDASNCSTLVNAGFYTKENTPIGYLKTSDGSVQIAKDSSLFNGFLTINDLGTPRITYDLPRDNINIGVQSGPMLVNNTIVNNLQIRNDKEARRTVAFTTGENKLHFVSIHKPNSMFSGPLLQELPQVLNAWQKQEGIVIADAINLDGGTASALLTEDVKITEASPIGSYFCVSQK